MYHGERDETFYYDISPIAKPSKFQNLNSINNDEIDVDSVLNDEWELSTDNDMTSFFDEPIFNLNYRQKHVLEWMIARESQDPYGGIIGKYLPMIRFNSIIVI